MNTHPSRGPGPRTAHYCRSRKVSKLRITALFTGWLVLSGCGKGNDDAERGRVEAEMKRWLVERVGELESAAGELERAAPVPSGRGWDREKDAQAISAMKAAWARGREAYELVEGALAPLFPDSDVATDARYDDFLATLGPKGDATPFDDQGVTGMHALERVLWADAIPPDVVTFERGLPGYRPATEPANEAEAREFKERLAHGLVTDTRALREQLEKVELDVAFAFRGLIDLTREQLEKVDRAATGREESRYAQSTLRDLRANHDGCLAAYRIFQPWLLARGHAELDSSVLAGFERLKAAYDRVSGAAIPRPPEGWSSIEPRAEHAETAFGKLFSLVRHETDDREPSSLAGNLLSVADALKLPKAVLR